jgi:hypothetical protein
MDISINKNYAEHCGRGSGIPDSCSKAPEFKLGSVTRYSDCICRNIPQFLQANAGIIPRFLSNSLLPKIISSIHALYSELVSQSTISVMLKT